MNQNIGLGGWATTINLYSDSNITIPTTIPNFNNWGFLITGGRPAGRSAGRPVGRPAGRPAGQPFFTPDYYYPPIPLSYMNLTFSNF